MRHQCKGRKLGSSYSHTKAMKRSLVRQLFLNDRIKTTDSRAKEIRGNVDKVITWAKKGDLHSRRLAIAALGNDKELTREIFEKVAQGMFEGRNGGYTRIMKLGPRKGDGAPVVIIELVTEPVASKGTKAAPKASPKKAAPKKVEKKDDSSESVLEEVKESIEAAEENFAAEVQAEGEEQLAEEKAEAAKEDAEIAEKAEEKEAEKAEEVREEQFAAEEAKAEDAKAEELKAEDEEKAK